MKTKFKVKADANQYILYQAGDDDRDPGDDDTEDAMRGYSRVGYYNTVEGLLRGIRERLLKSKTKKARDLESFLHTVVGLQQEILGEIKKQAFLSKKIRGPRPEEVA